MKRLKLNCILSPVLILFTINVLNAQSPGIEQFEWLLGSWKVKMSEGEVYESWTKQDENTLLGKGYYINKGDTTITEQLRIQKIGNYWTYIPTIRKNHPVLFTLISSGSDIWVFENKEHDFPQRIAYSQKKDGSLLAWIEGEMNGKQMKEEFLMEKIKQSPAANPK